MESANLRNRPTRFPGSTGAMILRFVGGIGLMLIVSIVNGFVLGYVISLFRAGPHAPWTPIDKNVGLESAIYGIIAGNLLAMIALAWSSSRRREWMLFSGGLAIFASEFLLLFFTRQEGADRSLLILVLATVLGAFVLGAAITFATYRPTPKG